MKKDSTYKKIISGAEGIHIYPITKEEYEIVLEFLNGEIESLPHWKSLLENFDMPKINKLLYDSRVLTLNPTYEFGRITYYIRAPDGKIINCISLIN